MTNDFVYVKPRSIAEVLDYLAKYKGDAAILAGGTDLINWLMEGVVEPRALIDIKGIESLGKIELRDNALVIGAFVTFSDLLESHLIKEKFPLLRELASQVASIGVRNRATVVGNICAAVPSCDSGPVLLVYDAQVMVKSLGGDKRVSIDDWFVGPKQTILAADEFVTELIIPCPPQKYAGCYVKLGRYQGEDLAQASVAIFMLQQEVKVAFGAVAAKPIKSNTLGRLLSGVELDEAVIKEAVGRVAGEIMPITDIRATKEYRLHMVKVMLERGLHATFARLRGDGPLYGTRLV